MEWQDAAYAAQQANKSPWVSLSDLGRMIIFMQYGEEAAAQCGDVADELAEGYMEYRGLTQEPLLHMQATVGGGAYYIKGKTPKPFDYVTEAEFGQLEGDLIGLVTECLEETEAH